MEKDFNIIDEKTFELPEIKEGYGYIYILYDDDQIVYYVGKSKNIF